MKQMPIIFNTYVHYLIININNIEININRALCTCLVYNTRNRVLEVHTYYVLWILTRLKFHYNLKISYRLNYFKVMYNTHYNNIN